MTGGTSRGKIIADDIVSRLPAWVLRTMVRLPTPTFKIIRDAKRLAHELGNRIVREKFAAARNGLDTDGDLFGLLCEWLYLENISTFSPSI